MNTLLVFGDGATIQTGNARTSAGNPGGQVEIRGRFYIIGDGYLIPANKQGEAEKNLGYTVLTSQP